jgi:hypothetical protein
MPLAALATGTQNCTGGHGLGVARASNTMSC